jgi:formate dehydrogenase subunit gamma
VALVLVVAASDLRGLRRTLRELAWFDADDRRWLRGRRAPQGRFNAAQKLNAAVTAAFAVLFAASGFLFWYGERDTRFRFPSTLVLHDGPMFASLVLVVGHLNLALVHPSTRHSLRAITRGSVRRDSALRHHPKGIEAASPAVKKDVRSWLPARSPEERDRQLPETTSRWA